MLSKHIHGNIMYITIELQDLEDSKPILLKVACCMVLIWPFVFSIFYVGCDKTEHLENIRCSDTTVFCCKCAK